MTRSTWSHSIDIDFRDMEDEIIEHIKSNFRPEEVYGVPELSEWAKDIFGSLK